jgi:hypothetical protein
MTPREIIAEAWAITRRESKLRRWGFFSSFFETLLNLKLVGYQLYFLHAYLTGQSVGFFDDVIWLYDIVSHPLFYTIVIAFLLLLLTEFIVPKLADGAIIGLAAKSHQGDEVKGGLILALYNFFPIFAIQEIFILSGISMVITLISWILRYVNGDARVPIIIIIIGICIFSNIVKFFCGFAEQGVVIRKIGIFAALGKSFKMIVSNVGHIMFLLLLLLVISLRVAINAVIVLLLPGIVVGIALLLALFLSPFLSYLIAIIIGMVLVFVVSYFFAYLHVFRQTVWTITYIQLSKKKDLDLIGD